MTTDAIPTKTRMAHAVAIPLEMYNITGISGQHFVLKKMLEIFEKIYLPQIDSGITNLQVT